MVRAEVAFWVMIGLAASALFIKQGTPFRAFLNVLVSAALALFVVSLFRS